MNYSDGGSSEESVTIDVSDLFLDEFESSFTDRFDPDVDTVEIADYISKGREYKSKIKVFFTCDECDNRWSSSYGTLEIEYKYISYHNENCIQFQAIIYKQECRKCKSMGSL
jgi:Zinc-binding domain